MLALYSALFILASYTIAVVVRWGIPKSLSRTFFSIKNKWIFSAVIAASFGLAFSPIMDILPLMWQWLGFLTVAGGMFVAFAPNLEDDLEELVHMGGAITLGLSSQGIVIVLSPWLLLLWVVWIPFASGDCRIFWAEMIGGAALFASLML